MRVFTRPKGASPSPTEEQKRPKTSPNRLFSGAARAFLTLALATCTFGAAASAQTVSISPPPDSPNRPDTTRPGTFEGSGGDTTNFNFSVNLSSVATQDVDVTYTITPPAGANASVGGADLATPLTGTVNIPRGTTTVTLPIPVVADNIDEADETFSVQLNSANGGVTIAGGGAGTASATIVDDDNAPVLSIQDPAPITEGNSGSQNVTFPVSLDVISGQDVTFNYSTRISDEENAGTNDFTAVNNAVGVIRAGSLTPETPVTVAITGDILDEADGQFNVDISNIVGADPGTTSATATILDNDGPTIRVDNVEVNEGDGVIEFRIQLSRPSPQDIEISYTTRGSSARAGDDYVETSGSFIIPAFTGGDPSTGTTVPFPISVPILDDDIDELNEIFTFNISTPDPNRARIGNSQAIGTIIDDDDSPDLTLSVSSAQTGGVLEGTVGSNNRLNFTVTLRNRSSRPTTFSYRTTSTGTATPGTDFRTINTTTGTIPALGNTFSIPVTIFGDNVDEADETVGVQIFGAGQGATINGRPSGGSDTTGQTVFGTIIDDDGPVVSVVAPGPTTEGNLNNNVASQTVRNFSVNLSAASPQPVTVTLTFGSDDPNEATIGRDYRTNSVTRTITIPAGTRSQAVPFTVFGDNIDEPNEIVTLTATATNGGTLAANPAAQAVIVDDDALPSINITGPGAVREGSTNGVTNFLFRVSLDRASSQEISVNYTVNNGTAVATGGVGVGDFDPSTSPNPLVFPAGQIGPLNIIVPVRADRLNEDDETFSVSLSSPQNSRINVSNATATIVNDDALPVLSVRDTAAQENGDPPAQGQQAGPRIFQFPVVLSAPSGQDVTFGFTSAGRDQNNPTLTALSGADFTPPLFTRVTIPAGETEATVPVTIVNDTLFEATETFTVTLLSPTNANIARATAFGFIGNDDAQPNIAIADPAADNSAIEPYPNETGEAPTGGRPAIFPVTLSAAAGVPVTVRYTVSGGTNPAAFNNDFLESSNNPTRIFQTGVRTFDVDPITGSTPRTLNLFLFPRGNDGNEPDTENFIVTITATNAQFAAAADDNANSTVADRDPSFTNYSPNIGFETFGGNEADRTGTTVTVTGNQFETDDIERVDAVLFNGSNTASTVEGEILTRGAASITVRVPDGAFSGPITLRLTDGRVLRPTAANARPIFFVQPYVDSLSVDEGVPEVTEVILGGRHFRDPLNAVTGVRFNGTAAAFTIVNDTTIRATVPRNATSGFITIVTANGGVGPNSAESFRIASLTSGGLRFDGQNSEPSYENAAAATVTLDGGAKVFVPVRSYNLLLQPAVQNNNNGPDLDIAPRRSFDVVVNLAANLPASASQRLPVIQLAGNVPGITPVGVSAGSTIRFTVAANRNVNASIPINVIYAGDDQLPPTAQLNVTGTTDFETGLTLPVTDTGVQMTLTARILTSNDQQLYPTTGQFSSVQQTFQRLDFRTFATDIGTTLRTSENQGAANNRAAFRLDLANLDFPNPEPFFDPFTGDVLASSSINIDARPKADVLVSLTSSNLAEARLTYYVLVNGQKVYPSGAGPQNTLQVIYAKDPNRAEYYRNPHFIEAIGQDDQVRDDDQLYRITATQIRSADTEYNFPISIPFDLVNTDNEQAGGPNDPAVVFNRTTVNTNENGSTATFNVSLRTLPTSDVTINFQSTRTDEVQFVDPTTGALVDNFSATLLRSGTGNGRTTSLYRTPLTISVRGIDDSLRDGDQTVPIVTTITSSGDAGYASIDPPDLTVVNADNESNGVTVSPTSLTLNENATSTFTVRLNAPPTAPVTITLFSSDTNVVTIENGATLQFAAGDTSAKTVTIRAIADGGFATQRTASIITSAANSDDPNFGGLAVSDVNVTVLNGDSAFVVGARAGGLRTTEGGASDLFTVALGQQPEQGNTVTLVLSASPASEARLSRTQSAPGSATPSITLTFNANTFANPQTVYVYGQDDQIVDGEQAFTITGRVTASLAGSIYSGQQFPSVLGFNADNDNGTGGGGGDSGVPTFAANGTYTFSVPFATSTAATATVPIRSLFAPSTATDFKIYAFDVANQQNTRIIGGDFQLLPNSASLQRGVGYILQTGNTALTLNTPSNSSLRPLSGTTYSFNLSRNLNFENQTGLKQTANGYNLIGFPFDPAQFSGVSFSTAQVTVGTDTRNSVGEAAAAGYINNRLFTMGPNGQLVEVVGDKIIRPYRAYFVQVYKDNVRLTLRSPLAN